MDKKWTLDIGIDLYHAGVTEDGSDFIAECYYVRANREDGKRTRHNVTFLGAEKETSEDGFDFFLDIRDAARRKAEIMLRILQESSQDFGQWTEIPPCYGSDYYVASAYEQELIEIEKEEFKLF